MTKEWAQSGMSDDATTEHADAAERSRLDDARDKGTAWRLWGPYLSERQWGTVRLPLREKDRATIEETFERLVELVNSLDEEQKRATREGLLEDELALFDLLQKDGLDMTARERVKQASRELLASIKARLAELDHFWEKEQTKAEGVYSRRGLHGPTHATVRERLPRPTYRFWSAQ
jgi:hypothetical protein